MINMNAVSVVVYVLISPICRSCDTCVLSCLYCTDMTCPISVE